MPVTPNGAKFDQLLVDVKKIPAITTKPTTQRLMTVRTLLTMVLSCRKKCPILVFPHLFLDFDLSVSAFIFFSSFRRAHRVHRTEDCLTFTPIRTKTLRIKVISRAKKSGRLPKPCVSSDSMCQTTKSPNYIPGRSNGQMHLRRTCQQHRL